MYIVYKHTAPNGKVYIGITQQSAEDRWRKGKGYKGCLLFNRAIEKYGWENIQHEILFEGLTKAEAEEKEILLIAEYKSNKKKFGYNIENGGNSTGKHGEETKRKIGITQKGKIVSEEARERMRKNHADVKKNKNPNYGKTMSDAQREKLRAANIGKHSGEKNLMFGKKHSEGSKLLMSENRKGKCLGSSNSKARKIIQVDLEGNDVAEYDCITDAERALRLARGCGGHISACAKGKLLTAYGYKWRYAEGGL